jgi:phage terminase large subunit-like protein
LALSLAPGGHPKGFYFDEAAALRAVAFIQKFCCHYKGEWAGQPFILSEWELFVVMCFFGWKRKDGLRRFRVAWIEVARKNGKSELISAIGLYLMVADGESGAEIYSTATKEDQAKIVWTTAKEMVKRSDALKQFITIRQKQLSCLRLTSFFRPLGADSTTLDGLNPHGHLCDEIHAHRDRGVFDVMITALASRRQPATFIITTAGVYDPESIGWELHDYALQILDGALEDDEFFAIVFAADVPEKVGDEDAPFWQLEAEWEKANPNIGISVKLDYLRQQCETAERRTSFLNTFKRLHLNVWTQQLTKWLAIEKWNACAVNPRGLEQFRGRIAYLGLDLSTKLDITALAIDMPGDDDSHDLAWMFFVPEGRVRERAAEKRKPDYAQWVDDGWLIATPGDVIDYDFIRVKIAELRGLLKVRQLGYDPWNATQLATQLQQEGWSVDPEAQKEQLVEMRQGMRTLSEPCKVFETATISGKFRHDGNPVMRWMVDNTVIRSDANGNIAPDKRSASGKIDGVVASVMALGRSIITPPPLQSVYERRTLRIF